ncbi:MAG: spermidine/putrescine ABC transporter substrate-binding protein [Chloroflexi bacterium]|nr:spermidine/putrescine ABC transporter substrate-binding protein [Chloroflexota bacterium]
MKKTLFYVLLLTVLILSACAPAGATEPAVPAGGGEDSGRCGDKSKLSKEIYLYNWADYIDPAIKEDFEKECGVKVVETNFGSNEEMLANLQSGGASYDIVVPSDYMIQTMIIEGMLMELDYSVITNIKHMDPIYLNAYFDPEQKYTVPYYFGTSGFAVNTAVVTEYANSWSMMFDPNSPYCGKISMLDDTREVIGAALIYLGYSVNDVDPAHLEEAKDLLIAQAKCVKAYDSQTNDDMLASGEVVLSHIWTGVWALVNAENEAIVYVIPEEGSAVYMDNLAIPVGAPNAYTAMVFLNYTQYPEIAAQNTRFVGYATPNVAAREFIDPEVLANESIYPKSDVAARLQYFEDVGDALALYDRIWTEFKAAVGSQ